jgi:hypothetical protein
MKYPGKGVNWDEERCLRGPVPRLKIRLRGEISKVGIIV